ncbi:hypothetical protein J1N35_035273 [Gossypium stocksii]|uniref:Uncharacterized protein n=1 Tax=Gossypium stocksii TaxID=47602 RepID=A0A9D3UTR6_9ROSI|nr:hypothetical protein J1N35_035273 [Gossypium stocksii]
MANEIENMSEKEDDMVENRGAMQGKKVAKIESAMSDVLTRVEDTEDFLEEIKFEMGES